MHSSLVVVGDESDYDAAMVLVSSSGRSAVIKLTSDPTNRLAESLDARIRYLKSLQNGVVGVVAD